MIAEQTEPELCEDIIYYYRDEFQSLVNGNPKPLISCTSERFRKKLRRWGLIEHIYEYRSGRMVASTLAQSILKQLRT